MSGGLDAETALLFWVDEALRLCGLLCLDLYGLCNMSGVELS